MGHCGEFGCSIGGGCAHPMEVNDSSSCVCTSCGVVCRGRFPGCPSVWTTGQSEPPTAVERDREFIALPYVGMDALDVPSAQLAPEAGPVSVPPAENTVPFEVALAFQDAVNKKLLRAIRQLEATVAELTAASARVPTPGANHASRRSVGVLQWVEPGGSQPPLAQRRRPLSGAPQERPAGGPKRTASARSASRRSGERRRHSS